VSSKGSAEGGMSVLGVFENGREKSKLPL